MGRAKGQAGAVQAGSFDAVLGQRRGLSAVDAQALHGLSDPAQPDLTTSVTYPLSHADAKALATEIHGADLNSDTPATQDLLDRALRCLNSQAGSFVDLDYNRIIVTAITEHAGRVGASENLKQRLAPLNQTLGFPRGQALTALDRADTKTYDKTWQLLEDGKEITMADVVQLAQEHCWDEARPDIAGQLADAEEEPFRTLLDKETYQELDTLTRGLFTRRQLRKFVTFDQWNTIIRDWDPTTGSDTLAQAVEQNVRENYERSLR